jgi:hypothetical protein
MTIEQRTELLKELSKMPQGGALKEYFAEKLNCLTDISNITSFEELLGRQVASKILKETIRFLDSLTENKTIKGNNQYV